MERVCPDRHIDSVKIGDIIRKEVDLIIIKKNISRKFLDRHLKNVE